MDYKDTYKTLDYQSGEVLHKEKNSRFFGCAFPVASEEEVKPIIENLKKKHPSARHWCYAYQIGTEKMRFRANDDGEPQNSAGMPIYGQILSFEVTNVLVVVVRYFGGIKLGVGGLISAYKTAARMALEAATVIEKTVDMHYILYFDYKDMNRAMRIIKERNLDIVSQKMEMSCEIEIKTRKKNAEECFGIFSGLHGIEIREKE
ncbi:MAG TPA: YigZ family protein [Flavobacterium sp.]|nr:YigZ family protein [Flavobacterium sp.]